MRRCNTGTDTYNHKSPNRVEKLDPLLEIEFSEEYSEEESKNSSEEESKNSSEEESKKSSEEESKESMSSLSAKDSTTVQAGSQHQAQLISIFFKQVDQQAQSFSNENAKKMIENPLLAKHPSLGMYHFELFRSIIRKQILRLRFTKILQIGLEDNLIGINKGYAKKDQPFVLSINNCSTICILPQKSIFYWVWDTYLMLYLIYTTLNVIISIIVGGYYENSIIYTILVVMEITYCLDILMSFFRIPYGYKGDKSDITLKIITNDYLKSIFILDLLSIADLCYMTSVYVSLLKLFRFCHLRRYIQTSAIMTKSLIMKFKPRAKKHKIKAITNLIIETIYSLYFALHIMTIGMILTYGQELVREEDAYTIQTGIEDEASNIGNTLHTGPGRVQQTPSDGAASHQNAFVVYAKFMYFLTTTLTTTGFGDIGTKKELHENNSNVYFYLMLITCEFIGVIFFGLFISRMKLICYLYSEEETVEMHKEEQFDIQLLNLDRQVKYTNFNRNQKKQDRSLMLKYRDIWIFRNKLDFMNSFESKFYYFLSPIFKEKIDHHLLTQYKKYFGVFFKPLGEKTAFSIIKKLEPLLFTKGDFLIKKDSQSPGLYLIRKGIVGIAHWNCNDINLIYYTSGGFCGENFIISDDFLCEYDIIVRSEQLEVLRITKPDILEILKYDQDGKRILRNYVLMRSINTHYRFTKINKLITQKISTLKKHRKRLSVVCKDFNSEHLSTVVGGKQISNGMKQIKNNEKHKSGYDVWSIDKNKKQSQKNTGQKIFQDQFDTAENPYDNTYYNPKYEKLGLNKKVGYQTNQSEHFNILGLHLQIGEMEEEIQFLLKVIGGDNMLEIFQAKIDEEMKHQPEYGELKKKNTELERSKPKQEETRMDTLKQNGLSNFVSYSVKSMRSIQEGGDNERQDNFVRKKDMKCLKKVKHNVSKNNNEDDLSVFSKINDPKSKAPVIDKFADREMSPGLKCRSSVFYKDDYKSPDLRQQMRMNAMSLNIKNSKPKLSMTSSMRSVTSFRTDGRQRRTSIAPGKQLFRENTEVVHEGSVYGRENIKGDNDVIKKSVYTESNCKLIRRSIRQLVPSIDGRRGLVFGNNPVVNNESIFTSLSNKIEIKDDFQGLGDVVKDFRGAKVDKKSRKRESNELIANLTNTLAIGQSDPGISILSDDRALIVPKVISLSERLMQQGTKNTKFLPGSNISSFGKSISKTFVPLSGFKKLENKNSVSVYNISASKSDTDEQKNSDSDDSSFSNDDCSLSNDNEFKKKKHVRSNVSISQVNGENSSSKHGKNPMKKHIGSNVSISQINDENSSSKPGQNPMKLDLSIANENLSASESSSNKNSDEFRKRENSLSSKFSDCHSNNSLKIVKSKNRLENNKKNINKQPSIATFKKSKSSRSTNRNKSSDDFKVNPQIKKLIATPIQPNLQSLQCISKYIDREEEKNQPDELSKKFRDDFAVFCLSKISRSKPIVCANEENMDKASQKSDDNKKEESLESSFENYSDNDSVNSDHHILENKKPDLLRVNIDDLFYEDEYDNEDKVDQNFDAKMYQQTANIGSVMNHLEGKQLKIVRRSYQLKETIIDELDGLYQQVQKESEDLV